MNGNGLGHGKTRVYITVDVEGAEERVVGGKPRPPLGYDARVWGRLQNRRDELGIGLIMREMRPFGFSGTFFVEVFGSSYFGVSGLQEICGELRGQGHDVQLHTHPIQRNVAFRSRGEPPLPDDMAAYDVNAQARLLAEGVDILVQCGVPRSEINAFRAGNFGANNDTWAAMAKVGLRVSSNFNPCYFSKNCKMRHEASHAGLFRTPSGVWELPISNFRQSNGSHLHLQITAVSLLEMKSYLREARRIGLGEVTIVTHSFEFLHLDSFEPEGSRGRPNTVNRLRLRGLCRFLDAHRDEFEVETVGALGRRLGAADEGAGADPDPRRRIGIPRGRSVYRVERLAEQALKRLEARLPISLPAI